MTPLSLKYLNDTAFKLQSSGCSTCQQVVDSVVRPATQGHGTRFTDHIPLHLQPSPGSHFVFVIADPAAHFSSEVVKPLMSALGNFNCNVFLPMFGVAHDPPEPFQCITARDAAAQDPACMGAVLLLNPNAGALNNIWCLYGERVVRGQGYYMDEVLAQRSQMRPPALTTLDPY